MRFGLSFLTALAVAALDQLSKAWLGEVSAPLIPGILKLTPVRNTGAAFGLFGQGTPWLALLSGAVILFIWLYQWKGKPAGLFNLGLSILAGGALGNLIDRVLLGYVVDFLALEFVSFPVFNLADVAVTCGCLLCLVAVLLHKEDAHG